MNIVRIDREDLIKGNYAELQNGNMLKFYC